ITLTGTNDAPLITSGTQSGAVTEDGTTTASGAATYSDVDTADTHTASYAPQAGAYLGTFALNSSAIDTGNGGSVGWSFSVDNAALQYLAAGQTLTQKYDVTVNDRPFPTRRSSDLITLTGTNDAPLITSGTQSGA